MGEPKPDFESIPNHDDKMPHDPEARRKLIEEIQILAAATMTPGPCAARSQDFLYDENGLPA